MTNFNLNHYVLIQIFPKGWEILKKNYSEDYIKHCVESYTIEIEGVVWHKLQLWSVMNMFGSHIYNGCIAPIGTNIKLEITE